MILVKEEPWNYDDKRIDKKLKMFTTSGISDMRFKNAIMLSLDDANRLMEPYYYKLKNNLMYFCDFDSNDTFLEDLFPIFHSHSNIKESVYDEEIKYK